MSRRAAGENSIYKDGSRWRGVIDLGRRPDGRRNRKKVSGASRAEVVKKLKALQKEFDAGLVVADDRLTVGAFLDRWVTETLPGTVSARTYESYSDQTRLHLRPALGAAVLRRLTVPQVDAVWRAKREAGYSPNSIRIMRTTFRLAIAQAEREGLVVRNVAALSKPPRIDSAEGRSLTLKQARTLRASLEGHRLEVVITIALAFGMRRGEALGLKWSSFDAEAATIRVTHAVKRVRTPPGSATKTELVIGELKTKRSRRVLYLTPPLVAMLRQHRSRQAAARLAAGEAWVDHDLVFTTAHGGPLDPDNFSHNFSALAKKAGLGHWHTHELRHSGASLMLAQGTDLYVVSEVLGHSSIAMTKDVYGHLVEGQKRKASGAMSDALFGSDGSQLGSQGASDAPKNDKETGS